MQLTPDTVIVPPRPESGVVAAGNARSGASALDAVAESDNAGNHVGVRTDRVLIYGPPGSGKSTLASSLDGYAHLEREQFETDAEFRQAVRRNRDERVAVVRTCGSPGELAEWSALVGATRAVLVDPGLDECKRRIAKRRRPKWRGEIAGAERWYSAAARAAPRRRLRATTSQRGYGATHQRIRREFAELVEGGLVLCARCGEPIVPGQPWDLGHHDLDRGAYTGPEHARSADCPLGGNRATAGRRGRKVSRQW